MSDTPEKYFDERLMCFVLSLSYDFDSRIGKLHVTDGGCCDMSGCVRLFKSIDPRVTKILPYSGTKEDVYYVKEDTKWLVFRPGDQLPMNECDDSSFSIERD